MTKAKGRSPRELHALASEGTAVDATADEAKAIREYIAERPADGRPDPDAELKADLRQMLRKVDIRVEDR